MEAGGVGGPIRDLRLLGTEVVRLHTDVRLTGRA